MGTRLTPEHLALYKKIDELLWNNGSPLGSSGSPEDRNEYYSYLPRVFRMTVDGSSCSAIAEYLQTIARKHPGASCNALQCFEIATSIVQERTVRSL